MKNTKYLFAVLAAVLAAGSVPNVASASGFLVARFGGEHGHPTTSHASAIYFNPAGLALSTGTRIYAEGLFALRSVTYNRPADAIDNARAAGEDGNGTPADAISANAGEANLSNTAAAPFLAVASDLGIKNLAVGAGLYVPFGGSAEWDKNDAYENNSTHPGAYDGVARWSSINGSARSLYITAAGAYHLPKQRVSVGLGLNVVMTSVHTLRARNADGTDDLLNNTGGLQEGRGLVDVSGTSFSFGVGAIWEAMPDKLWVGASYQARPGFKRMMLEGTLDSKLGTGPSSVSDIALQWSLPDVTRLGARFRPNDKLELRLFGEFVRWSVMKHHCGVNLDAKDAGCPLDSRGNPTTAEAQVLFNVPRKWEDAFGVRAGASYWVKPELEAFGGLGWDGNAVPDETMGPDLMDMNKVSLSLGARYEVMPKQLLVSATFTQVVYSDRSVDTRPDDAMGDPVAPFDAPSRLPDFGGDYSQSVSVFNLGVEYMF